MGDQCKIPVLELKEKLVCTPNDFQSTSTPVVTLGNGVIYDEQRQLCISTVPLVFSTPAVAVPAGISFGPNANRSAVSQYSLDLIKAIMIDSGNNSVLITSTLRTAADQARAMYENIIAKGVKYNYSLYGAAGDKVVKVAEQGIKKKHSKEQILTAMENEINRIGARKVSRHAGDPSKLNVIDISPRSVTFKDEFIRQVQKRKIKLLKPPDDPAYHLEIPQ